MTRVFNTRPLRDKLRKERLERKNDEKVVKSLPISGCGVPNYMGEFFRYVVPVKAHIKNILFELENAKPRQKVLFNISFYYGNSMTKYEVNPNEDSPELRKGIVVEEGTKIVGMIDAYDEEAFKDMRVWITFFLFYVEVSGKKPLQGTFLTQDN